MRKPCLLALRSLGLGLATALLIAWAIALAQPRGSLTCTGADHPHPAAVVTIQAPSLRTDALFRGLQTDPLASSPRLGNYAAITFIGGVSWSGSMTSHSGFRLHGGDRTVDSPLGPALPPGVDALAARSTGWPLPCLQSRATLTAAGWSGSWHIPMTRSWPPASTLFSASLPLRPLWPGLPADSALFAAAWAALLSLPHLARRLHAALLSRRQGRCRGCGYDLRGLPGPLCPECGRPAPLLSPPPRP